MEAPPLSVAIKVENSALAVGEPLILNCAFSALTEQPVTVHLGRWRRGWLECAVTDAHGNRVLEIPDQRRERVRDVWQTVWPAHTENVRLVVGQWIRLECPGDYNIALTANLPFLVRDLREYDDPPAGGSGVWQGMIRSLREPLELVRQRWMRMLGRGPHLPWEGPFEVLTMEEHATITVQHSKARLQELLAEARATVMRGTPWFEAVGAVEVVTAISEDEAAPVWGEVMRSPDVIAEWKALMAHRLQLVGSPGAIDLLCEVCWSPAIELQARSAADEALVQLHAFGNENQRRQIAARYEAHGEEVPPYCEPSDVCMTFG